jgi:hypothetical protein
LEGYEKDVVRKIMISNYIDTYEPDYNSWHPVINNTMPQ